MLKSIFRPTLVGIFLFLIVAGTHAATLTITNTFDGGSGSLRQAIIDATTNGEANVVTFSIPTSDPGFDINSNRFTISLASSLPSIPLAPFTLTNSQPQAVTIRGNNTFRVFTFVDSAVVIFNNLTITDGSSGAPNVAGRLLSFRGDITAGYGGAIYMGNSSTLNLNDCVVIGNSASINGGGIYMSNSSTAHISNSTISSNSAPNGGGGGVFINDSGTLNISSSTLNNNSALDGGGIFNGTSGTVNATTNTFDGNSAAGLGGAINNVATITLTNNTVTGNSAGSGGGIYNDFTATLENNIIAVNSALSGTDLAGGSAYLGNYNLIGNADGSTGLALAPNISGTTALPIDPMLGPLQDNGGITMTHAVLAGSPAIDNGSTTMPLDQRGSLRPFDSAMVPNGPGNASDMGAYEFRLGPSTSRVTVGGRVSIASPRCDRDVIGARVTITNLFGVEQTVSTGIGGRYRFDYVEAGASYVVSVRHPLYPFDVKIISLEDNMSNLDFVSITDGMVKCNR